MTKRTTPRVKKHAVDEFYRELRRGGKTKTRIYEDLALEYGVESKTVRRWVSKSPDIWKKQIEHLEEQVKILASGDFYVDEDTGEIKQPEPIPQISKDGRLLA